MGIVNESRAFYNSSFNTRMKKYATACELREKRKRAKKPALPFHMTNEFTLPSLESILQKNPNTNATALNLELMNYEDELTDQEEENNTTMAV